MLDDFCASNHVLWGSFLTNCTECLYVECHCAECHRANVSCSEEKLISKLNILLESIKFDIPFLKVNPNFFVHIRLLEKFKFSLVQLNRL